MHVQNMQKHVNVAYRRFYRFSQVENMHMRHIYNSNNIDIIMSDFSKCMKLQKNQKRHFLFLLNIDCMGCLKVVISGNTKT